MGYTKTDHNDGIIRRRIRSERAHSRGLAGSSFTTADELEALLLEAGPARPMTAARKARIYGDLKP